MFRRGMTLEEVQAMIAQYGYEVMEESEWDGHLCLDVLQTLQEGVTVEFTGDVVTDLTPFATWAY